MTENPKDSAAAPAMCESACETPPDSAPAAGNGEPAGPPSAAVVAPSVQEPAEASPAAVEPPTREPRPPSPSSERQPRRPWLAPDDGPALMTELQDLRICTRCGAPVPIDANDCPKCHSFVVGNPGRKSRKGDVDKILSQLVAEYQPATVVLRETCEHLARAYAELKTMPAGSLEWHRILNITQELTKSLDASRSPSSLPGLSTMPDAAVYLAHDLVAREVSGEPLSEFQRGQLDVLRGAMEGAILLAPDPVHAGLPVPAEGRPQARLDPTVALAPKTGKKSFPILPLSERDSDLPERQPARCAFCGQIPCIGIEHREYQRLHRFDADAQEQIRQRLRDIHGDEHERAWFEELILGYLPFDRL